MVVIPLLTVIGPILSLSMPNVDAARVHNQFRKVITLVLILLTMLPVFIPLVIATLAFICLISNVKDFTNGIKMIEHYMKKFIL